MVRNTKVSSVGLKGVGALNIICRKILLRVFFAGFLVLGVAGHGVALGTDTAYWNELVFKHKLNKKLTLHFKTEQWFLGDVSRLGLYNFTPGVKYSWSKYVDIELNYRYQRLKLLDELTAEHRLEIIPYLKGEWAGFRFELRNRLELRNIDGDNSLRLRERIQITRNFKYENWDFDYYISNEFFYDSNPNDINQNRAKVGVTKQISPNISAGLYYMYWTIEGESFFKANVIGSIFQFLF